MGIFSGPNKSDLYGEIPHSTPPGYNSETDADGVSGPDDTANREDYQWGGGGEEMAKRALERGAAWGSHPTNWDTGTRTQQLALADQVGQDQVSSAGAQGQAAGDQAMRNAMLARSHGVQAMQANQGIQGQQMQAIAGAGNQRAQDSATAQGMYGSVLGQGRDIDTKEVGFDAHQKAQMQLYYQQLANRIRTQQLQASTSREEQNILNWQRFYQTDQSTQKAEADQQRADNARTDRMVGNVAKAGGADAQAYGAS